MQIPELGQMAFASKNKFKSHKYYTGSNTIGSSGVQMLVKADWTCLKSLNLSKNCINDKGVLHLITANWPLLEDINLGNYEQTQLTIKSEIRPVLIYAKENGLICSKLTYVIIIYIFR